MQGKGGGCCIARCATGAAAHDMANVHRIMMRFRPIAPKPSSVPSPEYGNDAVSRSIRTKRKYNNTGSKRGIRRRRTAPPPTLTLPLLPETPDQKDSNPLENSCYSAAGKVDLPAAVGSVVTVECVTETWKEEREVLLPLLRNLEEDTCPGFVSDGYGRVTWTNGAYREIVGEGGVWLLVTEEVNTCGGGFTCRVRVEDTCGKVRTVPCDVWRMEGGGFAWRLDVAAALTLSLAL